MIVRLLRTIQKKERQSRINRNGKEKQAKPDRPKCKFFLR
jgi:hypothetical protein